MELLLKPLEGYSMNKEFTAIVYDTETTGLIKPTANKISEQPYITEIYCAKLLHKEGGSIEQIDEFEQLYHVPVPLSKEITRITGLTDEDLVNQPSFGQRYKRLATFFTGVNRLVAHNLAFDRSMVANELVRIDKVIEFPWPMNHICTVEKTIHIEQRRMNLTRLHNHLFGCGFPDAHRAKNDVLPLVRCYVELCKRGMI